MLRIIGGTGHRPKSLGSSYPQVIGRLNKLAYWYLMKEKPDKVVSGMALGWDMAIATICQKENIPYIAAIPFPQQADVWPAHYKEHWEFLKSRAERVIMVDDHYSPKALFKRNEVIVDESTGIAALFNGIPKGGTFHCLEYARLKGKTVTNLYNEYLRL
jgi:uncharacterized phage-like protein YoqJ